MPYFNLIGWDISVDKNGNPAMIEWNRAAELSQVAHGPAFGEYTEVESVTYKKWKPLARVGMVVHSEIDGNRSKTSYKLTIEKEDGTISFFDDKQINSVLKKKECLLKYSPYPITLFIDKFSTSFFHKNGLKNRKDITINLDGD